MGSNSISEIIGSIPYRMALAGGWIDQPFVSKHNPDPFGSMVVVAFEPTLRLMERSGMATGTRAVATRLWNGRLPDRPQEQLVRELYAEENKHLVDPSGSQDMIGLIYPGICRLDYDYKHEGGIFPRHIEQNNDPKIAAWIEKVIHVVPYAPRPPGYSPLGIKNLDPKWIQKLGQSGKDCYAAILARDAKALGASMSLSVGCWKSILPHVMSHPSLHPEMPALLEYYQQRYQGAMYSGCGGGYIYVVSENEPVPGSFNIKVRIAR